MGEIINNNFNIMKPKISINKLGEYITANPLRRKRITEEQKNPSTFIVARYTEVRDAYIEYVLSKNSPSIIETAIKNISNKLTSSDFQTNDKNNSIDALRCYDEIPFPNLSAFELFPFTGDGKIDIAGVDVSVMPDIILKGTYRNKNIVGAIKFNITKTTTLNEENRKNVATILHQFLEERVKSEDEITPFNFCFSIDIFSKKCENAPSSYKNRRTQIHASCEEYKLWWETL